MKQVFGWLSVWLTGAATLLLCVAVPLPTRLSVHVVGLTLVLVALGVGSWFGYMAASDTDIPLTPTRWMSRSSHRGTYVAVYGVLITGCLAVAAVSAANMIGRMLGCQH